MSTSFRLQVHLYLICLMYTNIGLQVQILLISSKKYNFVCIASFYFDQLFLCRHSCIIHYLESSSFLMVSKLFKKEDELLMMILFWSHLPLIMFITNKGLERCRKNCFYGRAFVKESKSWSFVWTSETWRRFLETWSQMK